MFDQREILGLFNVGRFDKAVEILQAHPDRATDAQIELHLGLAHKLRGNLPLAIAAFERALSIEPYHFVAMLSKASALEHMGMLSDAVICYRHALRMAPSIEERSGALSKQMAHASELVAKFDQDKYKTLISETSSEASSLSGEKRERFEESVAILSGQKKPFLQQPLLFYYPGLPSICFWERDYFPWLPELEAKTDVFRSEIRSFLKAPSSHARPYVDYPAGAPLNQWQQLNKSDDWTTVHLWRDGQKNEEIIEPFRQTFGHLEALPIARQTGFAPTAMYSMLAPRTLIPPHTGSTNVRQIVHLAIDIPDGCRFRVGNFEREWTEGKAWVFDDSIEHEAENKSDKLRIILIFDVWNPLLGPEERNAITKLMLAARSFQHRAS